MRRLLIGILIAVLITALWYFFVVSPITERRDTAQQDLENAQTEEFTLQTTLSRLRKIEENQLEYATAIGQLQTAIPETARLDELIDDLNFLADENGLEWNSASYALPALIEGTDVYEIAVSIQVDGQFFEVLGYLYGIAELERIVRVDSVALSSGTDEAGFHSMNATIDAVAFTTSDVSIPLDLSSLFPTEETTEETTDDTTDTTEGTTDTTVGTTDTTVGATDTTIGSDADQASTTTTTVVGG